MLWVNPSSRRYSDLLDPIWLNSSSLIRPRPNHRSHSVHTRQHSLPYEKDTQSALLIPAYARTLPEAELGVKCALGVEVRFELTVM